MSAATMAELPEQTHTLALKDAMSRFATGVTVVTTHHEGQDYGMTCNSFNTVSLEPPMVMWSIRNNSAARTAFVESGTYLVNILASNQKQAALSFTQGSHAQRFESVPHVRSPSGKAQIAGALAWFDCTVVQTIAAGDHTILLGAVNSSGAQAGAALIYEQRHFGSMQALP